MKPLTICGWLFSAITSLALFLQGSLAADPGAPPEQIGIYDSRVIAYAHFWSKSHQNHLNALVQDAKQARASGDTNRLAMLDAELKEERERNHLQVFSTAPVDDVLAGLSNRVAIVKRETGVTRLISKWDEAALKQTPRARRVDVTDRLLDEFTLTEKQMKVIADLRSKSPLPLDKASKLVREGKL